MGVTIIMTVTVEGGTKLQEFFDSINLLPKARVDIGFFPEAKYVDGTQVASVAMWDEFGTESDDGKKLIPPRPFLIPTYEENKKKWFEMFKSELNKQIEKNQKIDVIKILKKIGFVAQKSVQEKIDWWAAQGVPRNAASTIEKKGFDSPLIQDGHMRESVDSKVSY